jgi:hypothetical protein
MSWALKSERRRGERDIPNQGESESQGDLRHDLCIRDGEFDRRHEPQHL